jgi:drug/metabolite transporter (DMT)-like permease
VRRPALVLAATCTAWGTIPLVVRAVDLPAEAIVGVRLWSGAATLALVLWLRPTQAAGPRLLSVSPARTVATGVVLAVHWVAFFAAYQRAAAGTVILIVYLAPVAVAALAPTVLGERHGPRTIPALAVAVVGAALIAAPELGSASWSGVVLAAVAGLTFAGLLLLGKPLADAYGGLRLALQQLGIAGVCLVPVALAAPWGPPRPEWLWLLVLGAGHTAVGSALYLGALGRLPATTTGVLGYLEPASVVVCAWAFLGESPSPLMLAGGLLVVVAGAVIVFAEHAIPAPVEVPTGVPG